MKKFLLTLTVISFLAVTSNAQIFVGGSLGFNTESGSFKSAGTTTDIGSAFNFNIAPKVGYFLSDDIAVGASVGFSYDSRTPFGAADPKDKDITTGFLIAPFARYYALEMGGLRLFGEAEFGMVFGSIKHKTGSSTNDGDSSFDLGINLKPGASYKLTEKIEIEAFLTGLNFGINSVTKPNDDKTTTTNFGLNLSTGLGLGFVYKL